MGTVKVQFSSDNDVLLYQIKVNKLLYCKNNFRFRLIMIPVTSAIVFALYSITACLANSPPIYHPAPAPYHPAPAPYHPAPAPYHPAPYHPAPKPVYHPAPKAAYHPAPPVESYGAPFSCPNYPYCSEAPYSIYHLQHEIEALRHRAALIVKHGENLQNQLPNQPFVEGL